MKFRYETGDWSHNSKKSKVFGWILFLAQVKVQHTSHIQVIYRLTCEVLHSLLPPTIWICLGAKHVRNTIRPIDPTPLDFLVAWNGLWMLFSPLVVMVTHCFDGWECVTSARPRRGPAHGWLRWAAGRWRSRPADWWADWHQGPANTWPAKKRNWVLQKQLWEHPRDEN